jgi:hypothetical protein
MDKVFLAAAGIVLTTVLFSCATPRAAQIAGPVPETAKTPEKPAPSAGKRPEPPETPEFILGQGQVSPGDMNSFLLHANPQADPLYTDTISRFYIEEAAAEGVNHDVAFAQMCLETGFLRYGGLVTADMNNFCGLGSIGPGQPGEYFPSPRIGVRAHIQHLKAYATDAPLRRDLVDPRYRWVSYGSAPTLEGLTGTWAADREYAAKIRAVLTRLYAFSYKSGGPEETPGF